MRTPFERHSRNDLAGKLPSLTSSQILALVTRIGHIKSACIVAAAEPLNGTSLGPGHKHTLQLESSTGPEEADEDMQAPHQPALLVFSGGTAFNSVAGSLRNFTTRVAHVLPVSDDGGSTAEIVRVLGGPAVGDIRSRCLRLADDSNTEGKAVRELLAHRLSPRNSEEARREWYEIVEGEHALWDGVSEPYKHTIRAFLVHFHTQILRNSSERFNFRNGSVGNFFFAGARTFFNSLEAAIFLFSRVARIPEGSSVMPVISTEERITLGAVLSNGLVIKGQNQISHPSVADTPGPNQVNKMAVGSELEAPIQRIFYLRHEGRQRDHEVFPDPNPALLADLEACDAVLYGMGSLYTSICPSLILQGVGERIAARDVPKIVILNGSHDRETSACMAGPGPMGAADVVLALQDCLNRRYTDTELSLPGDAYVTAMLVPAGGEVHVDKHRLTSLGVRQIVEVDAMQDGGSPCQFEPEALVNAIKHIVEQHAAFQDGRQSANHNADSENGVLTDVQQAPPLGFHDL
ncbi:hypothetical protein WJX77_000853 [Trebouxia sp. C0004]